MALAHHQTFYGSHLRRGPMKIISFSWAKIWVNRAPSSAAGMEQNEDNPTQHSLKLVWNSFHLFFGCADIYMLFGSFWFNFHKFVGRVPTFEHVQTVQSFSVPSLCWSNPKLFNFPSREGKGNNLVTFSQAKKTCSPSFLPKKLLEVSSGANHLSCTLLARTSQAGGSHHTTGC